jgi:alkylation response protein AidB-like acyl-CoA dehydrogenase
MAGTGNHDSGRSKGIDNFARPDHLISDEAKTFCKVLRKFVDNELLPHEDEFDDFWDWTERDHSFVDDLIKKLLIDMGVQRSFVPPPYGGTGGGSLVELGAIAAELGRGDLGFCESALISSWVIPSIMLPTPNEAMMKKIAESLCGNEVYIMCSAMTEPHAGGGIEDLSLKGSQIRTTARLEGNEWVVNGHKLWPSASREAKMFQVFCAVKDEKFPNNIAQIMIPRDAPGVSTGKPYKKMGCSVSTNGDIWFENVRVPRENRLHENPEEEILSIRAKITVGRVTGNCFALGAMRRGYEILRSYVVNREIGGRPMKEHGVIVHELGQIATDMLTAEALTFNTLERLDRPEVYGPPWDHKQLAAASVCQNVVGELVSRALNRALLLMGSYGYAKEGKIEKLVRDVKINEIAVGGTMLRLTEAARYYFGTETI